tara:strand:+ start:2519 stop:2770 length:252 start_codon:yes stop_codon:yes gene_type:complete
MTENVENWLIEWFTKNTSSNNEEIISSLNENFFEKNWMDSLKFIEFISNIEAKFGIVFDNNEFQDRSFSTIKGLAKIIERKNE